MLPHEFSATRHFSESSIHLSIRSSPLSSSLFTFTLFKLTRWRSADATSHYSYLVFVKGSAAFPTPPKARKDAAGATTVVMPCSYATVECLPTARPTNQPQPDRRARRGEGWSGDWNYGTMEGGGLAVGAGDDNIRLALVRPPPLLPPLSHTL